MDEKNKKSDKQLGFLDLIKERIRNKPTRSNDSQASPVSSQAPSPSQEEKLPPARAIINVAPNSLLFTLWYEWKTAGSGQTGGLKAGGAIGGAGHTGEASFALEPFEIAMEPPGMPKLPISTQELEAEKRRATIQLMARARKHYQLTLPDREGNVPDVDAEMYIHVAQSRMAAWAFLFPPAGNGKPLRPAQVDMALQEYSVSAGISREALDGLIQEQPYFKLVPIAYGIPPVDGRDGAVVEKFSRAPKVDYRPDEHGNMDYRTLNNIQTVHAGDLICEELPPTPGTDGMDVLGSPIPAKAGRPARITPGRNTELSGEPGRLTASVDGHLQYANGSFQVNPLLEIRGNVDLKVGNIDFLGDVHISGDVLDNFVIHAAGSVIVDGLVEGAAIEAGGDILIAKGILGDEKAVIKAGGSIKTGYIENCVVYAKEAVEADSIISSSVQSDGRISVCSGRGTIIGGKMVAATRIEARIIGCRAERHTTLVVGETPYIQIHKDELNLALQNLEREKKDLERSVRFFMQDTQDDPERLQHTADSRILLSALAMREQRLRKELESFERSAPELSSCEIRAEEIYPITTMKFQYLTETVKEKTVNVRAHVKNDAIVLF